MTFKTFTVSILAAMGLLSAWGAPPVLTPSTRPAANLIDWQARFSNAPDSRAAREQMRLAAEKEGETLMAVAGQRIASAGQEIPSAEVGIEKAGYEIDASQFRRVHSVGTAPAQRARRAPGKAKPGNAFSREYNYNTGKNNANKITLAKVDEGAYTMTNVRGYNTTINLNIDEATGYVEIPSQKLYTHSVYGELWICPVNIEQGAYTTEEPVRGTINADGVISLSHWGVFVVAGDYINANLGVFTETKWLPVNGSISITAPKAENNQTLETAVEQVSDNEINVFNIVGNSNYVSIRLYPDKSVKMSPQWVFTNPTLGDVCVYKADFQNNKINYSLPVEGTATPTSVSLGGWVAALRSGQGVAVQAVSTLITIEGKELRFPEATPFSLSGSGTEADPYLVKSASDMQALSEAVAGGNSFSGKHFRMDADISLAALTQAWEAIGAEATPFAGTFDGNSHTISGLTLDGHGFPEVGIFGWLTSAASVRNLNVEKCMLRSAGASVGVIAAVSYGTISDCSVNANIISTGEVAGGIAGQSNGKIENCFFSGTISGTGCIAGIAGLCYGSITRCHTLANIELTGMTSSMYHQAAGIVGQLLTPKNSPTAFISDCYAGGSVSDTYGYSGVGGIVCLAAQAKIERCFNTAAISALHRNTEYDLYVGGVAAWSQGSTIHDCFNAGTIIKTLGQGVEGSEMVGGIVGYISVSYTYSSTGVSINNVSDIDRCYNSGQVIAPSTAGHKGIYGDSYFSADFDPVALSVKECWFDNQVNPFDDERYGRPTSFFTSSLPAGLPSSTWVAESGYYPMLAGLDASTSANLAKATITLDANEDASKVKLTSTLKASDGVSWRLYENNQFTLSTASLKIDGSQLRVLNEYGTNMVVASTPDGQVKVVRIAAVPKAFDGEGTQSSPYLIKSVADMVRLNEAVGKFAQPHKGDFFRLTTDLDFAGSSFAGIGTAANGFGGEFDGDGHRISNLTINSAAKQEWYCGLFHTATATSAIRNLTIDPSCRFTFFHYSAPIVGYTEGVVDNCVNLADVTQSGSYGAGIAGLAGETASISRCYNSGHITAAGNGAAGIVGMNIGSISRCQNDGDITSLHDMGEAGGIASAHAGSIDLCVNNSTVTARANVGGIAGQTTTQYEAGDITRSLVNGMVEITGTGTFRGAFVGYMIGTPRLEGNVYDASVNIGGSVASYGRQGIDGVPTITLTDGKEVLSLPADEFSFEKGKYPVLNLFAEMPASATLRSMHVRFAEGESRANLTLDADLSAADGLAWEIKKGDNFRINGSKLNVTVPEGMKVVADTLTARSAGLVKTYALRTMPDVLDGKGSISDPYRITSAADLNKLAVFMDSTLMEYTDYYFRVMNDIDCTGAEFKPIGHSVKFNGVFDGDGKRIYGIDYVNKDYKTGRSIGFFGSVGEKGLVKSLTLEGRIEGHSYVGSFTGRLYGTLENCVNRMVPVASVGSNAYIAGLAATANSGSKITGCVNEANISADKPFVGGIAANITVDATVENCVNKGNITAGGTTAGGIGAAGAGSFIDCRNEGTITATQIAGGIIARSQGAKTVTLSGCVNTGEIKASTGGTVGGIVGSVPLTSSVEITDCHNSGSITAKAMTGGIVGEVKSGTTMTFCSNSGTIHATGYTGTPTGSAGGLTGQFCGATNYPSLMEDCFNTGSVTGHEAYTGGISGKVTSATVRHCYNLGDVTSEKSSAAGAKKVWETGGITGNNTGPLEYCWNAGTIRSNGYAAGGISGLPQANLTGCFNLGDVTVTDGFDHLAWGGVAGGVFGYTASKGVITACYNMGTVTAPDYAGGIASGVSSGWEIHNCYNAGKVVATDEGASHIYEIGGPTSTSITGVVRSGLFFLDGVNPHIAATAGLDESAGRLDEAALSEAGLGASFRYEKYCLPTIADTRENSYANHAAVGIGFREGETAADVKTSVFLGALDNLVWSATANIDILDGRAIPNALGDAVLTVATTDGKRVKNFSFHVSALGVDNAFAGSEAVATQYFDLSGRLIPRPQPGTVCIVRTVFADGKAITRKTVAD